jgi:iron complex outermembrane recepter protein
MLLYRTKTWLGIVLTVWLSLQVRTVAAQRTGENVVTAARDAFGTSIGNERIGLYNISEVRGFSPLDAGNVRIEGFWYDQQAHLTSRLVQSSMVHVGLTAQGYPFPAPTGIVDYQLRKADDELVFSLLTGAGEFLGPFVELDAKVPIVPKRFGVAAGVSYAHEEYYDGSDASVAAFALIPRWRPIAGVEIVPFYSFELSRDEQVAPYVVTSGPFLPPRFERRRYYGQPWAILDTNITNTGVQAKTQLGESWEVTAGVFRTVRAVPRDHAELFNDTSARGGTRESVIADPPQRRESTGGELIVAWAAQEGPRLHQLRLRVLGRIRNSALGGSSMAVDLGERQLGEQQAVAAPAFELGERTQDRLRQWMAGLAYEGRWRDRAELSVGVQRADYEKTVTLPELAPSRTRATPWLLNAALALHITRALAAYAGFTRGLEENGIAPGSARNRNAVLPSILTQQIDAGLRYAFTPEIRLVLGVFDLRKPNFTTDQDNVFRELGEIRNRGIELSFTGELFERLRWVAGAVLMRARVDGPDVDAGRIGPKPVGQPDRSLRFNVFYRLPIPEGLSFDAGILHVGERNASSDNRISAPAYTTLDLGARYQFTFNDWPATLRLQVTNVFNAYNWRVIASNTFRTSDPRSISATLAVDFQ